MVRYLFIMFALLIAGPAHAQSNGERLEAFVEKLPRNLVGLPMYWLEMETAVGWENMMLIFGYADNAPPCQLLATFAKKDSPDRNYRCAIAN